MLLRIHVKYYGGFDKTSNKTLHFFSHAKHSRVSLSREWAGWESHAATPADSPFHSDRPGHANTPSHSDRPSQADSPTVRVTLIGKVTQIARVTQWASNSSRAATTSQADSPSHSDGRWQMSALNSILVRQWKN